MLLFEVTLKKRGDNHTSIPCFPNKKYLVQKINLVFKRNGFSKKKKIFFNSVLGYPGVKDVRWWHNFYLNLKKLL